MLEGNFIFSDRNFVRKADGSGITFTKRAGITFMAFQTTRNGKLNFRLGIKTIKSKLWHYE